MADGPVRSFLFLQGPLSPLYRRLAGELERAGHTVHRINLCFGDWLQWRRAGATNFRGRIEDWPQFIDGFVRARGITDVILHGDQRPYHRLAAEVARRAGAQVIVTELGYLRPDWMTLELDGVGAASYFPREPEQIRGLAHGAPALDLAPLHEVQFARVAIPDVVYNLSSTALWFAFPHFRRHTIYFPPVEYLAWLKRLVTSRRRDRRAETTIRQTIAAGIPLFVLPLQLEGDFQVRAHSPFAGQAEMLDFVISSFCRHAPTDAVLLIKTHPLDNGLERWPQVVAETAERRQVSDRVHILDGGRLDRLWPAARGVVTINSSAGLEALQAGVPVKTLGRAIYAAPGMTHRGPLDVFWQAPERPDMSLVSDFVRALAATVQVRGTLYSRDGLAAAVANMTRRILADDLLEPAEDIDPFQSEAA